MRVLERGVLKAFASWFKAGIGLGVMLFMAFTILSVLGHDTERVQGVAKPAYVSRPAVVQQAQDDYRIIRERNRFVSDLVDHLSRIVNRVVR